MDGEMYAYTLNLQHIFHCENREKLHGDNLMQMWVQSLSNHSILAAIQRYLNVQLPTTRSIVGNVIPWLFTIITLRISKHYIMRMNKCPYTLKLQPWYSHTDTVTFHQLHLFPGFFDWHLPHCSTCFDQNNPFCFMGTKIKTNRL